MRKKQILMGMLMLAMAGIIMQPNKVEAALQANGGDPARYNATQWRTEIRQMQATGGTLGLTDEIDATTLTSQNKNLDIHMQKNTEYGGLVILSASAYGNSQKIENGDTTTGNKTGVVMQINREWVSGGYDVANIAGRYKDVYTGTYVEKPGDGIKAGGWHGATGNIWLSGGGVSSLVRANSGSIFSYCGRGQYSIPGSRYSSRCCMGI